MIELEKAVLGQQQDILQSVKTKAASPQTCPKTRESSPDRFSSTMPGCTLKGEKYPGSRFIATSVTTILVTPKYPESSSGWPYPTPSTPWSRPAPARSSGTPAAAAVTVSRPKSQNAAKSVVAARTGNGIEPRGYRSMNPPSSTAMQMETETLNSCCKPELEPLS